MRVSIRTVLSALGVVFTAYLAVGGLVWTRTPEHPFAMPPGVSTARIDPATGTLASSDDPNAMLEVFKTEDIARLAAHPDENDENSEAKQREAYDIF